MQTNQITPFIVSIDNDELSKCTDEMALRSYLRTIVGPNILTFFSSQPIGAKGWEVGGSVSCSDRGCSVGISIGGRF